jgi:hypothetical protein
MKAAFDARETLKTRTICEVPWCERSQAVRGDETPGRHWLCSDHWRLVPRLAKLVFRRRLKRHKINPDDGMTHRLMWDAWWRCVSFAIERAFGIR